MDKPRANPVLRLSSIGAAALAIASSVWTGELLGQAAVDPNVAPRAAALERAGERRMAIGLLGRYLATAPTTDEPGSSSAVSTCSMRVTGTSKATGEIPMAFSTWISRPPPSTRRSGSRWTPALVFRGLAELERSVVFVEDSAGTPALGLGVRRRPAAAALYSRAGRQPPRLLPGRWRASGGHRLEALSVWYDTANWLAARHPPAPPRRCMPPTPLRRRMAEAMEADPGLRSGARSTGVAARRPLCLRPTADSAAAPALTWTASRLAWVSRPVHARPRGLSLTELLNRHAPGRSVWVVEVRGVYDSAARYNGLLCSSFLRSSETRRRRRP